MAKVAEREQALILRKKGHGIKEIARVLDVSKGTVSYWCRDIPLSTKQIERLQSRSSARALSALLEASERKRSLRIARSSLDAEAGKRDLGQLTSRDILMLGLGLYWGEGYKRGSEECGFTNSDASMVRFYIHFLSKVYGVPKERLIARVSINESHADRINDVHRYWSKVTGIPLTQFTKISLIRTKTKKRYSNHAHHFGTLRIKVRGGTSLRRRILGSLESVRERVK